MWHTHTKIDTHTPLTKVMCNSFSMLRCICWFCVAVFPPALHPAHTVCLLFRGILCACTCVSTQTCCHFPLLQAQLWFGGWYCLAFFYSHSIFVCLICSMTSSPRRSILQSNRMPVHRICVMSLLMFVYVLLSPINENSCTTCANDSIPTEIYWANLWSSLFLSVFVWLCG